LLCNDAITCCREKFIACDLITFLHRDKHTHTVIDNTQREERERVRERERDRESRERMYVIPAKWTGFLLFHSGFVMMSEALVHMQIKQRVCVSEREREKERERGRERERRERVSETMRDRERECVCVCMYVCMYVCAYVRVSGESGVRECVR